MGSEALSPVVDEVNVPMDASIDRPCPTKKNQGKVPKRIHKAEREKLKREHLNELFLDLANALVYRIDHFEDGDGLYLTDSPCTELTQQNSGKAFVLCEATRLLKDLFGQIDSLSKENASLLSESHYVTAEKNELKEENTALESQIEKLQSELEARVVHSKPDLNVPPPEFHPELASHCRGDGFRLPAVEPALQQASAVLVVPIHSNLQAFSTPDSVQLTSKTASNVSKPHARYPTSVDSWPSQLLGESICSSENNASSNI